MIDFINTTFTLSLMLIILIYTIKKSETNNLSKLNIDNRIKKIRILLDTTDDSQSFASDCHIANEIDISDKLYQKTTNINVNKLKKRILKKSIILLDNYNKEIKEYIKYVTKLEKKLEIYKKRNKYLKNKLKRQKS